MRRFRWTAAFSVAVAYAAWLARAEMHTDDTGMLVGLIGLGGFLLSAFEPRRPWIWGTIVPSGIVAVNFWRSPGSLSGWPAIAAVTLAVGCMGAYAGAFIRRHAGSA